jgi:hypothetical protein
MLPAWSAAVTVAATANPAQYGWVSGSSRCVCGGFFPPVCGCGCLRAVSVWVPVAECFGLTGLRVIVL